MTPRTFHYLFIFVFAGLCLTAARGDESPSALSPAVQFFDSIDPLFLHQEKCYVVCVDGDAPPTPVTLADGETIDSFLKVRGASVSAKDNAFATVLVFAAGNKSPAMPSNAGTDCPALRIYAPSRRALISALMGFTESSWSFDGEFTDEFSDDTPRFTVPSPRPTQEAIRLLAINFDYDVEKRADSYAFRSRIVVSRQADGTLDRYHEEQLASLRAKIAHYQEFPVLSEPAPPEIFELARAGELHTADLLRPIAMDAKHPWSDEARVGLNLLGSPIPERELAKVLFVEPVIRGQFEALETTDARDIAAAVIDQVFLPFGGNLSMTMMQRTGDDFIFYGKTTNGPGNWRIDVTDITGETASVRTLYSFGQMGKIRDEKVEFKQGRWLVMELIDVN